MSAQIRISNIPCTFTEEQILRLCVSFGELLGYHIIGSSNKECSAGVVEKTCLSDLASQKPQHAGTLAASEKGRSYVMIVTYEEKDDAVAAVANMDGMECESQYLRACMNVE